MSYARITPIPADAASLASPELASLEQVWRERRTELESGGQLERFLRRLRREWAIETGIIERLYTWDCGVTEVLIEQGIDAALIAHRTRLSRDEAEQVGLMIRDQEQVIEGLFGMVKGAEPLSNHFMRSLHAQFTAHQDTTEAVDPLGQVVHVRLLKGAFKERPNNPRREDGTVHEYCPPELVQDEMDQLVTWYREANGSVAPEVLSAWLHHRFTRIHPFQDGNGRVARALASLVFLRAHLFPLTLRDRDRTPYIEALEEADAGDLERLVALFVKRQKDAILGALSVDSEVRRETALDAILAAAERTLERRRDRRLEELRSVFDTGDRLKEVTRQFLESVRDDVERAIQPHTPPGQEPFEAWTEVSDQTTDSYYRRQIIGVARKLDYFANFDIYSAWARLGIRTKDRFNLVVSFHGIGRAFQGVLVASCFSYRVAEGPVAGQYDPVELHPAAEEPFQFNYAEPAESAKERFRGWLEACAAIGLERWRRTLG